ncbi:LysM peptidoglycan-binding domain-containing protein [Promineifilum sp.]|uniref:LysM peptidoglycan-binding domain-containing protein n=1 Tax=Promineifilum sp. TaxID=2664178 RepID=UPI0035B2B4ED
MQQSNRSGCALRLPQLIIILVVASLLAVGIFLAIPYLRGRPEFPRGTFPVYIEGNQVIVTMDPDQEVFLIPIGGVGEIPGIGGQAGVSTATPSIISTLTVPTVTPQILPSAAPATAVPPIAILPTRASCITFTNYTVAAGDTLFSISRKYVTTIALMARHGISSTSLVPGAVLRVPIGDPACCPAGWKPYAVNEGETWFSIAQACGTTVEALQQGNGVGAGGTLYMASIICVPQN